MMAHDRRLPRRIRRAVRLVRVLEAGLAMVPVMATLIGLVMLAHARVMPVTRWLLIAAIMLVIAFECQRIAIRRVKTMRVRLLKAPQAALHGWLTRYCGDGASVHSWYSNEVGGVGIGAAAITPDGMTIADRETGFNLTYVAFDRLQGVQILRGSERHIVMLEYRDDQGEIVRKYLTFRQSAPAIEWNGRLRSRVPGKLGAERPAAKIATPGQLLCRAI